MGRKRPLRYHSETGSKPRSVGAITRQCAMATGLDLPSQHGTHATPACRPRYAFPCRAHSTTGPNFTLRPSHCRLGRPGRHEGKPLKCAGYPGKRCMQRHVGCGARKFAPVSGASLIRFNVERCYRSNALGHRRNALHAAGWDAEGGIQDDQRTDREDLHAMPRRRAATPHNPALTGRQPLLCGSGA
jgi:hypothetical protein